MTATRPTDDAEGTAFAQALAAARILAWEWEVRDGGRVRLAGDAESIFGPAAPEELADFEALMGRIHPEDRPRVEQVVQRAVAERGTYHTDFRTCFPDGSVHEAVTDGRAIMAQDGRVVLIGTTRNADPEHVAQRAAEAARSADDAQARLDAFFRAAPIGMALLDTGRRYLRINATLAAAHGTSVARHLGKRPAEVMPESVALVVDDAVRRALETGEPVEDVQLLGGTPEAPQHWSADVFPALTSTGERAGVGMIARNVTDRVHSEAQRAAALRRTAMLAEASALLEASLDYYGTLDRLSRLVVERVAAWCVVDLFEGRELRPVVAEHRDLARAMEGRERPAAELELARRVGTTGRPECAADGRLLAVPLTARGRILGVLSLVAATNARYDEDDLALAVELGRRAALAVDNARLFRAAHAEQRRSEEARATLDSYLEQAPVGFALFDDRLRFVRANAALAELDGIPAAEHAGRRAPELLGDVGDDVERLLKQVLTTGEVVSDVEVRGTLPAFPGRERQWLMSFYRVRLPGGDALGIGGTIVEVTERLRIEQALTGQRDLYETLLRAQSEMGEAFVLLEGAQAIYVNEAAERMTMRPAQELYDLPSLLELFPEPSHGGLDGYVRDVLARRPGVDGFETELVTPAGTRVAVELAAQPLEVDGRRRLVVVARDVSERRRQSIERERLLAAERRARRETEVAHERARMLAELSEVLDRSMELRRTLPEANRVLLRHGADVAGIDVVAREGQTVERMAVGAATPERDATQQLLVGSTYPLDSPNPWATVARTRKPLVTGDLAVDVIRGMAGSDAELDTLLQTAPRSVVFLPLVARGRTVGVMGLGWDASRKVPTGEERAHLEEVARRLATGIDNAQLYAERAHIASTLQAGLLPPALPDIPGIDAAARYLPAGEASEVGGDFYDLYPTTADRWAVVVGDVCGKGAEAAAVTAMARYTLRAATIAGPANPGNSLALLNAAMVTERIAERFLTAVLGELRLGDGHADLVLSCAGHPAPLIVRADGRIEPVEAHGALLGVAEGVTWEETELRLGRGDAIVLYTDGVTEADRRRPMEPGDLAAELLAAHPDGPPATAAALADAVRHVAEQRAQGPLRDDVAIVALRLV